MRKTVRPFHKLEFYWTDAVEGKYDIPIIKPIYEVEDVEWIGFNYAKTEPHPENKGCHFFLDDYQFERVWNRPYLYLPILKRFKYVTAPAFSFYRDVSYAVSIYNHYRKHFLASYWQANGIQVIPVIHACWPDSWDWCFDGEPHNSVVATETVGLFRDKEGRLVKSNAFMEMQRRLNPNKIMVFGFDVFTDEVDRSLIEFHKMGTNERFDQIHLAEINQQIEVANCGQVELC